MNISVRDGAGAQGELNGFLRSHRILTVERRFVDLGENSFWSFCVDDLEPSGPVSASTPWKFGGRDKIDDREVLSDEDFAIFAQLRQLRKEIAQADAVPVYTIFTNEQLAKMVQNKSVTRTDLEKIAGVGSFRVS